MSQHQAAHKSTIDRDPRRIQVLFGGHGIAASTGALVVREPGRAPVWYFPRQDVEMLVLHATGLRGEAGPRGQATYFTLYRDANVIENAAWSFEDPPARFESIAGHIAFDPAHFDFEAEGHAPAEWRTMAARPAH